MGPLAALGKNVLLEVFETHLYSQMENDHCHCDAVLPSGDATYMGILPVNGLIIDNHMLIHTVTTRHGKNNWVSFTKTY